MMGVFHRLIIVVITLSQRSKWWTLVSVNCISKLLLFFGSFPQCDWSVSPHCSYHGCTHHPFSSETLQSIPSTLTRVTILKCKLDPVPSTLKYFKVFLLHLGFSTIPSLVKNLPAVQEPQETQVQSLGREDPLEEGMETHRSILAWRIPWTEELGWL